MQPVEEIVLNENIALNEIPFKKTDSLLKVRTGNQCITDAKNKPIPKMLFSEFWHEGELSICFADTNLGKSILAVQIANSISKGEPINGFQLTANKQKVLYFDFEMADKQFEQRYSQDYQNHYIWDEKLLRVDINSDCTTFDTTDSAMYKEIEKAIIETEAKILIIDNLTYLKNETTETAKEALPLMKRLKELKVKHELSILALAHTPKRYSSMPITNNDIAGSKHLANFADSIFAIGESFKNKKLRYLKQIKARATEIIYDSENIVICEVTKPYNFLGFEYVGSDEERGHLRAVSEGQISEIDSTILELKRSEPAISNYAIGKRLNINAMKVGRVLERHQVGTDSNSSNA